MESVIELTRKLVQTDTTLGKSKDGALILKDFFEENGIDARIDEYAPGEANIVAKIGPKDAKKIILSGHIDTVPFGDSNEWVHDPLSAQISEGVMWGRGTVDMKGGTSALAHSFVDAIKIESELSHQIVFAGSAQEEVGLLGAKHLEKNGLMQDAEYLIIGEPTNLEPKSFEKGIIWFNVAAKGKQAHASRPELGKNAIEALGRIMPKLKECLPDYSIPEVGQTTINFGMIKGGSAYNVVAENAVLSCDVRTTPGIDNSKVIEIVKQVLSTQDDGIEYEFELVQEDKAVQSKTQDFPKLVKNVVEQFKGHSVEIGGTYYATDAAALMANTDINMVILGPGSTELLHQTNERIEINELVEAQQIYSEIIKRLNS